jgi:hypothetical protein
MDAEAPARLVLRSLAEVATPRAERYLQQLCKHFGHKVAVTFDPRSGKVEPRGNPQAKYFFAVLDALQRATGVRPEVRAVRDTA